MYDDARFPRRPHIPVALYALIVVLVAERSILYEGRGWTEGLACRAFAGMGLLLMVLSLVLWWRSHAAWPQMLLVGMALAASAASASAFVYSGNRFVECMGATPVSTWCFRINTDPIQRTSGYRCRATASNEYGMCGDVWMVIPQAVCLGSRITCVGTFQKNGDDEWGTTSRCQGVWGTVRATRMLSIYDGGWAASIIQRVRQRVLNMLDPASSSERALLAGCVCGWREGLVAFGLDDVFSRSGLSHLVAVSGSHIAVLSVLLAAAMETMRVGSRTRLLVLATSAGLFVILCGAPVSAIRSWVMACSALAGRMMGRRSYALSSVCIVGLCLALPDAGISGQLGYTLSVSAVVGLCLFRAYAEYAISVLLGRVGMPWALPCGVSKFMRRAITTLQASLAASIVAQISTMPIALESFGQVSIVGPLASMVVSVPFTLMLGMALIGVACWWIPMVQGAVLELTGMCAHLLLQVVTFFGQVPGATVMVQDHVQLISGLSFLSMVAVLLAWPRISRRWFRAAILMVAFAVCIQTVRWRYFAPARVCILDVGQGDAILIQHGASAVLVDAGPDESVVQALSRNHVYHLDAVVVTHLHDDHYGGVASLEGEVSCDDVFVAQGVAQNAPKDLRQEWRCLTGRDVREISCGDTMRVGGFTLEVVWPFREVGGDENGDSLEIKVTYEGEGRRLRALLTGDAEKDQTGTLVSSGIVGNIDLLKVGHHGSEVSITKEQARTLDPEVAVASAGKNNSYGHPSKACVEALEGSGALFLCTKDVGDVEISPGTESIVVRTQRS